MKKLGSVLFRQRVKLDDYIITGIDILRKLIHWLSNSESSTDSEQSDEILDFELQFEESFSQFLQSLDKKYYLPFYWEDMYEVYSNLKKIVTILQTYAVEKRIYKVHYSFSHFLKFEDRILENILEFFRDYLSNRKYAGELLKNNQHEIKNFVRLYYQGIASLSREQAQSHTISRLLENFLEINTVNNTIQDLIQKILIGTNL
jgi:hypothetical protein